MKKLKLFVTTITAIFISTISVHATVVELGQDDFKTNIESGGEYKLKENINISDIIEIDDNLILDLNGKTITGTAARIFNIRNGNVTLKNGTIKNENISSDAAIIYIYGHSSGTGTTVVNLENGLTIEGISGVVVSNNSGNNFGITVNIGATINSNMKQNGVDTSALFVHGRVTAGNPVINITGKLTGIQAGIYQAGDSTINIQAEAEVEGASGIVTKSGTLKTTNATIRGTGTYQPSTSTSDGFNPTGSAIQIESNDTDDKEVNIDINGGEITSQNNSVIEEYGGTTKTAVQTINIGGNAVLTSANDKEIITGSTKFATQNKNFIGEGTTLKGQTNNIQNYLAINTQVSESGVVGIVSNIIVYVPEHGTLSSNKHNAAEGETVTLTVTPDENYELESIIVTDAKGNVISVENNRFTMPDSEVKVTATFKAILANYEQLDEIIKKAEEIEQEKYTEDSYKKLEETIKEAKELSRELKISEQETIDNLVKKLENAIQNLEEKIENNKEESSNPQTGDRIATYVITGVVSIILVIIGIVLLKKRQK